MRHDRAQSFFEGAAVLAALFVLGDLILNWSM